MQLFPRVNIESLVLMGLRQRFTVGMITMIQRRAILKILIPTK